MSLLSRAIRRVYTRKDALRDSGLKTPDDIIRFDNIPYDDKHKEWNLLDVYRPKYSEISKLPVIIVVHGGAWVYSTKDTYQHYAMSLAQRGFAVINASYRLAPEYKFPAQLEDVNSYVHWMYKHADEYGFDTDNLFMVGDSAGAHIMGLYLAICLNERYARNFTFEPPKDFMPRAVAFNCGVYNIFRRGRKITDLKVKQLVRDLLEHDGDDSEIKLTNLTDHITYRFPPAYIITSNGDYLKHQAPVLTYAYDNCGIEYIFKEFGDENNKLLHVFHVNVKTKDSKKCNDAEVEFFKSKIVK